MLKQEIWFWLEEGEGLDYKQLFDLLEDHAHYLESEAWLLTNKVGKHRQEPRGILCEIVIGFDDDVAALYHNAVNVQRLLHYALEAAGMTIQSESCFTP